MFICNVIPGTCIYYGVDFPHKGHRSFLAFTACYNNYAEFQHCKTHPYPVGFSCQNDVVWMSMRRNHVASTLIRRHFYAMCPLSTCHTRRGVMTLQDWAQSSQDHHTVPENLKDVMQFSSPTPVTN